MIMSSTVQRPRALYRVLRQVCNVWVTLGTHTNLIAAKQHIKESPYGGPKVIQVELQEIQ